jgi:RHS repeat-associated protein
VALEKSFANVLSYTIAYRRVVSTYLCPNNFCTPRTDIPPLRSIVAQVNTSAEYFLGDALGSVRQLVDANAEITLSKAYDPYGSVAYSVGSGTSPFAFTGEQTDVSGLTYLRARYYSSTDGRFLSRDTWGGDYNRPLSLNRWIYVEGNPVNATDPTGNITQKESYKANKIVEELKINYNVYINVDWGIVWWHKYDYLPWNGIPFSSIHCEWWDGNWKSTKELELTLLAVEDLAKEIGGKERFRTAMKGYAIKVYRVDSELFLGAGAFSVNNVIIPNNVFASTDEWAKGQVVHELAHVWDIRSNLRLGRELMFRTHSFTHVCHTLGCADVYNANQSIEEAPTDYAKNNEREDWAESVKIFTYPSFSGARPLGPIRKEYIEEVIQNLP